MYSLHCSPQMARLNSPRHNYHHPQLPMMNIQKAARFPVSYHKMVIPSMYVHNGTMLHHPLYLRQQKMMFRMFLNMFLHFWMVFSRSPTGVGKCPNSWDFGHDQNRSVLNMISKKKHDYWLSETFHWLFNVIQLSWFLNRLQTGNSSCFNHV